MSCFLPISYVFSVMSMVGLLRKLGASLYTFSQQFWLRNRQGFVALYGIQVACFFDIVYPSVNLSLYVFYV